MGLRLAVVLAAPCLLLVLAASAGAARAGLGLEPAIGPPTSLVKVKGSDFANGEIVALYFDSGRVGSDQANLTLGGH
jgi:hypothetical protein